jgi:hypothetical protein
VLRRTRQDWERLVCEQAASRAALLKLGRACREAASGARVRCAALQGDLAAARRRAQQGGGGGAAEAAADAVAEHVAAVGEALGALLTVCDGALHPSRPVSRGGSPVPAGGKAQPALTRGVQLRFKRLQRAVAWLSQLLDRSRLVLLVA